MVISDSKITAQAAIKISLADTRGEEKALQSEFLKKNIYTAAVDFGGLFNESVLKMIEKALVAAKRENVIGGEHAEEGAIIGATHAAIEQIMPQAFGLNVGGKIGISRFGGHISVAVFLGVGMVHLDDICIGIAHRAVSL